MAEFFWKNKKPKGASFKYDFLNGVEAIINEAYTAYGIRVRDGIGIGSPIYRPTLVQINGDVTDNEAKEPLVLGQQDDGQCCYCYTGFPPFEKPYNDVVMAILRLSQDCGYTADVLIVNGKVSKRAGHLYKVGLKAVNDTK